MVTRRGREEEWTLDYLEELVRLEAPEFSKLELKRDLTLADDAKGWRAKGKLHPSERDGLAKEVVALSNSYGGQIIIGIEETDDMPKRAKSLAEPLPKLHDLVDSLRNSLTSVIDPPISGLSVNAILAASKSSDGYVVIDVPQSTAAPHGYGLPPKTYIRRDDKSEPASMNDLQSIFWEARTRRERIEKDIEKFTKRIEQANIRANHIGYDFFAISEFPLSLTNLAKDLRSGTIAQRPNSLRCYDPGAATETPDNNHRWRPTSYGADYQFGSNSDFRIGRWQLDQVGVISVSGDVPIHKRDEHTTPQVFPSWFAQGMGHLVGLVQIVSTYADHPGDWIIGGAIRCDNEVTAVSSEREIFRGGQLYSGISTLRSIRLSGDRSNSAALSALSENIWAAFHLLKDASPSLENGIKEMEQFRVS